MTAQDREETRGALFKYYKEIKPSNEYYKIKCYD